MFFVFCGPLIRLQSLCDICRHRRHIPSCPFSLYVRIHRPRVCILLFRDLFTHSLSRMRKCRLILDIGLDNSPTARAPFEVASLFIFSMLWLG
jgi:hypothetical protein